MSKIVLTGTAAVGKTTLIEELAKLDCFAGYEIIPEQARELCVEQGYKNIYEISDIDKFRFDVLARQIELESKFDHFVADRSVIDSWVYYDFWARNFIDDDGSLLDISHKLGDDAKQLCDDFAQQAKAHAQNYDLLVFLPKTSNTPDDGFRWSNESYQEKIESMLLETIKAWGLEDKLYKIKSNDLAGRIQELQNSIGKL